MFQQEQPIGAGDTVELCIQASDIQLHEHDEMVQSLLPRPSSVIRTSEERYTPQLALEWLGKETCTMDSLPACDASPYGNSARQAQSSESRSNSREGPLKHISQEVLWPEPQVSSQSLTQSGTCMQKLDLPALSPLTRRLIAATKCNSFDTGLICRAIRKRLDWKPDSATSVLVQLQGPLRKNGRRHGWIDGIIISLAQRDLVIRYERHRSELNSDSMRKFVRWHSRSQDSAKTRIGLRAGLAILQLERACRSVGVWAIASAYGRWYNIPKADIKAMCADLGEAQCAEFVEEMRKLAPLVLSAQACFNGCLAVAGTGPRPISTT